MKPLLFPLGKAGRRNGFSLVEATLSLGLFSIGFLILLTLLDVEGRMARLSQDDRATAQIAQFLAEEAREGTLSPGASYFDSQGTSCPVAQATFRAEPQLSAVETNAFLTRLTLRVTPVGAPDRPRIYALVFAPSS